MQTRVGATGVVMVTNHDVGSTDEAVGVACPLILLVLRGEGGFVVK